SRAMGCSSQASLTVRSMGSYQCMKTRLAVSRAPPSRAHPANAQRPKPDGHSVGLSAAVDVLDQGANDPRLLAGVEESPHRLEFCEQHPQIGFAHRFAFETPEFPNYLPR